MKTRFLISFLLILLLSITIVYGESVLGYTNISDICIYQNSNYSSQVVDTLKINTALQILEDNSEWCKVKTEDGKIGWIEKYFLNLPAKKYVLNNTDNKINIRKGPSTTYGSVGQLLPNEKAKYIDTYHSWHIIEYNGSQYYIASWLTDIVSDGTESIYLLYDNINIRDNISLNSNIIGKGNKYDSFEVYGEQNGWIKIKLNDGQFGFIAGWLTSYDVNFHSEGDNGYKKTTAELNLRTDPSHNSQQITTLSKNSNLKIISSENGWDKVITENGQVGWCNNSYLKSIQPLANKKILLDPGHGGYDPGCISFTGKYEKYVNLDVAFKLKRNLEELGATVYMTRTDDTYIKNSARGRMADSLGVDILLSIHHNSLGTGRPEYYGLSTYYNTINYKSPRYGYDLAESIYLNAVTINGVYRDGILDRNFEVLRETNTPAALIEIGFMSNPLEEMNVHNESFQYEMVQKISDGIVDYFK